MASDVGSYKAETTFHGIPQILTARSWALKAVWLLFFGGAIALFIAEVHNIVIEYQTHPYATDITTYEMTSFPVIGLCPPDSVDPWKALIDAGLNGEQLDAIFGVLPDIWSENVFTGYEPSSDAVEQSAEYRKQFSLYSDMLKSLTADLDLKIECTGCLTNSTLQAHKYVKSTGVCHVIDAGDVEQDGSQVIEVRIAYHPREPAEIPSWEWGDLDEEAQEDEAQRAAGTFSRLRAFMRLRGIDVDREYDGIVYWDPESDYPSALDNIQDLFSRIVLKDTPEEHNITLNATLSADYADNPKFRLMIGTDQAYQFEKYGDVWTQDKKDLIVLVNMVRKTLSSERKTCSNYPAGRGSIANTPCKKRCLNRELKEQCNSTCYLYLGEVEEQQLVDENDGGNVEFCQTSAISTKQAECHREIVESEICESVPSYTWSTFLSNIGGMFGLCLGASLLSIVHTVFFFCEQLVKKIKDRRTRPT